MTKYQRLRDRHSTRPGSTGLAVVLALAGAACSAGSPTGPGPQANGSAGSSAIPAGPPIAGAPAAGSSGAAGTTATNTGAAGTSPPIAVAGSDGGGQVVDMGTAGTDGAAGTDGGAAGSGPHEASCLDGITNYDSDGPFQFEAKTSGQVKMWVPMVPAGCKVPMVHLANGTGATCSAYAASLTRLASHGFLALCYENTNTGAGTQGIMAFQTALMEYPDLADMKFGSTGHSQGGQASFIVLQFAEKEWGDAGIYAGLAMEPASGFGSQPAGGTWQSIYGMIKSPMFMFSGVGSDGLVSQAWVQQAFDAMPASTETYFWAKQGATHIPVPNGEEQQISIPWFRWKLLGDNEACKAFKAIPMMDTTWVDVASKNEVDCK